MRRPHHAPHIPHQHPLIPPATRAPPLGPKQAPIQADHELRMRVHAPQLSRATRLRRNQPLRLRPRPRPDRAPVAPHAHRHVVARAQQHVRQVRAPRHAAHRIIMARQHGERAGPRFASCPRSRRGLVAAARAADVERAYRAIDAGDRDDPFAVLVPVVRQRLGGRVVRGVVRGERQDAAGGGRGGCAQVEEAQVRVGGDGGEQGGGVRAEGGAVGAGVGGEGEEGGGAVGGVLGARRLAASTGGEEEGR